MGGSRPSGEVRITVDETSEYADPPTVEGLCDGVLTARYTEPPRFVQIRLHSHRGEATLRVDLEAMKFQMMVDKTDGSGVLILEHDVVVQEYDFTHWW